jgi:hypothetical protein
MNYARQEDKPFRMLAAFVAVTVVLILAGAAIPAHAQTYKVLYDFLDNGPGPQWPGGPLAQGRDGDLYGYSYFDGTTNNGSIWKTTLRWTVLTANVPTGAVTGQAEIQDLAARMVKLETMLAAKR